MKKVRFLTFFFLIGKMEQDHLSNSRTDEIKELLQFGKEVKAFFTLFRFQFTKI